MWRAFIAEAGLKPKTYDSELEVVIRAKLGLDGRGSTGQQLARLGVSVADLLNAVLEAIAPFARMLTDLLGLYAHIAATTGQRDNLRIAYDFSSSAPELDFDLGSFREWTNRWVSAVEPVPSMRATPRQLWALQQSLRTVDEEIRSASTAAESLGNFRAWLSWPERLPPVPTSLTPALNDNLARAFEVADAVLQLSRQRSASPAALQYAPGVGPDFEGALDPAGSPPAASSAQLLALHQDDWLSTVVAHAYQSARLADRGQLAPNALGRISDALDALPQDDVLRERAIRDLLDVLSLPVWGRRHELYSAWLLSQIVDALGRSHVKVHVTEGRLQFSFAGTHVATVESGLGPLELWAELRHPYATPIGKGRRYGIQPDYTLSKPPITRDESAVVVVEAKQYKQGKRGAFLDALTDYVGGHARARVILANYGSMPLSVIREAPERAVPLGTVRPGSAACETFREEIRAAVPPPLERVPTARPAFAGTGAAAASGVAALVTLEWIAGGDLDLHLVERTGRITSFASIPNQTPETPVQLWNDDVASPGRELAHILAGAGPVALWVHRYASDLPMPACGAVVHIDSRGRARRSVACSPGVAASPWWFVGVLQENGDFAEDNAGHGHLQVQTA